MSNKDNELVQKIMMQTLSEHQTYTEDYIEGMEAGIVAALQNQQGSVNTELLEALKQMKRRLEFFEENQAGKRYYIDWYGINHIITNAESSKPDHIPDVSKMVDPRDELEELAKIEQKCLKMLPMFTEAKDAEIKALKETIIGLSKKDEQIRILRELVILFGEELEASKECRLETLFNNMPKEMAIYREIAAADKLNKQE